MRRIWGPAAVGLLGVGLLLNAFTPLSAQVPQQGQVVPQGQPVPGQAVVQPGQQGGMMAAGGPRYTIVETEGTNLLVVDNSTNTLYYYTVDEGKEVGDDLKLRGTVDLRQVGQPVIRPVATAKAAPGKSNP